MRSLFFVFVTLGLLTYQQNVLGQAGCLVDGEMYVTDTACCPAVDSTITFWNQVTFNNCTTAIHHWTWDFGDGQIRMTSTDTAHHVYSAPGGYIVIATPRDVNDSIIGNQLTTEFAHPINVYTASQCTACLLIDWSFENILCGVSYTKFHDGSFVPNCDTSGIIYSWNFGDDTSGVYNTSSLASPEHKFTSGAIYTVTLTITLPQNQNRPVECEKTLSYQVDASANMPIFVPVPTLTISTSPTDINTSVMFQFNGSQTYYDTSSTVITFGDSPTYVHWDLNSILSYQYLAPGVYSGLVILFPNREAFPNQELECQFEVPFVITVVAIALDCKDCIGSFSPEPGKRYLIDAWVREDGAGPLVTNFSKPALGLSFYDMNGVITNLTSMQAKGEIIDGWQRIEEEFVVPYNAVGITIQMKCTSGDCLFDDIRVFPYDGMMKGYVYDPLTLKLVAELDERNYATFYEYDEEGKLIRVKKETERGIMTIKENRNHTSNK